MAAEDRTFTDIDGFQTPGSHWLQRICIQVLKMMLAISFEPVKKFFVKPNKLKLYFKSTAVVYRGRITKIVSLFSLPLIILYILSCMAVEYLIFRISTYPDILGTHKPIYIYTNAN